MTVLAHLGPGFGGIEMTASIWYDVAQCLWPGSACLMNALVILALVCDLGLSTLSWHHAALCLLPLSSSADLVAALATEVFDEPLDNAGSVSFINEGRSAPGGGRWSCQ